MFTPEVRMLLSLKTLQPWL